jgi:hypothetical protein
MTIQKPIRAHWLSIRLNDDEHRQLTELYRQTTHRSISDYARRTILKKPVNVRYRNASVDDFLTDMLPLKQDLNQLSRNFNIAVEHLRTLQFTGDLEHWIIANEADKTIILSKVDAILTRINQLYQLWSQE